MKPFLEERKEGYWTMREVLKEDLVPEIMGRGKDDDDDDDHDEVKGGGGMMARLAQGEAKRMETLDPINSPLWQITLYTPSSSSQSKSSYLTLSIDHVLTDGKGALTLLGLLLTPTLPTDLPFEQLDKIPLLEETIDIRPPYWFLLPIVWKSLIVPKLPKIISNLLPKEKEQWPGKNFDKGPCEAEGRIQSLQISADLVRSLKSNGKKQGVSTLHPIIKTAYLIAIFTQYESFTAWQKSSDASPSSSSPSFSSSSGTCTGFHVNTGTPKSERSSTLGHGVCTGNYVSALSYSTTLTGATSFWAEAKKMGKELSSHAGIKRGRYGMGMLGYVPDGEIIGTETDSTSSTSSRGKSSSPSFPTKWEQHFWQSTHSPIPISEALEVSNISLGHNQLLRSHQRLPSL